MDVVTESEELCCSKLLLYSELMKECSEQSESSSCSYVGSWESWSICGWLLASYSGLAKERSKHALSSFEPLLTCLYDNVLSLMPSNYYTDIC